jgi:hypothetical protein
MLRQLTLKSCYPSEESTFFPPNHLMYISEIWAISEMNKKQKERPAPSLRRDRQQLTVLFFPNSSPILGDSDTEKTATSFAGRSFGSGFRALKNQKITLIYFLMVRGYETYTLLFEGQFFKICSIRELFGRKVCSFMVQKMNEGRERFSQLHHDGMNGGVVR